jgi:hypothetical protein
VIALALASCGAQGPAPKLAYRVARTEIDLGDTWWTTPEIPAVPLSILNLSEQTLLVTPLRFDGEGAGPLTWRDFLDYTEVRPGDSASVWLTLAADGTGWRSGAGAAELVVEVGVAWNDPADFDVAPQWFGDELVVPVSYTIDCDLDDDGLDAAFCGGDDCDDAGGGLDTGSGPCG